MLPEDSSAPGASVDSELGLGSSSSLRAAISRLTRSDLEELVLSSVASGVHVTRQHLATIARAPRTNILDLSDDTLWEILRHLPFEDRIRATRVCKQWRKLKGMRAAWDDLYEVDFCRMTAERVSSIIKWLPDEGSCVRALQLAALPHTPPETLDLLMTTPSALEKLTLRGRKFSTRHIKLLAKQARTLTHLTIADTHAKANPALLAEMAALMTRLESLSLTSSVMGSADEWRKGELPILESLVRAATSPAQLALTALHINAYERDVTWSFRAGLPSLPLLRWLSAHAPRLHTLNLACVGDLHTFGLAGAQQLPAMPSLRQLTLRGVLVDVSSPSLASAQEERVEFTEGSLSALLAAVFAAAPKLEVLRLRAPCEHRKRSSKAPVLAEFPFARLGGALSAHPPPASLHTLELRYLEVHADDFEDVELPALRSLELRACTGAPVAAVRKMRERYLAKGVTISTFAGAYDPTADAWSISAGERDEFA